MSLEQTTSLDSMQPDAGVKKPGGERSAQEDFEKLEEQKNPPRPNMSPVFEYETDRYRLVNPHTTRIS